MSKSVYLINPQALPGYYGAEVCTHLKLTPAVWVADPAITTIAALAPDDFVITLCEQHLTPADLDTAADYIGLTGKSSQVGAMLELAKAYRQRGKTVLIGGPFASLSPDTVRPYCDILVRGEIEDIAMDLFDDLRTGRWRREYVGGRPDLTSSPIPRWELYPNEQALLGCVQTSRGCPFECEFCDVIQYVGRKQRHKSIAQILAELDKLYQLGYKNVFFADDNFTVYRRRTKELLKALRDWNHRQPEGALRFSTQLSIDIARDDDILQLCAEAGLGYVYIGIETPNEASLKETKKHQNVGIDLLGQIQRFLDHGIAIMGGMIVGFDSDGPDIFEQQYHFAMSTPIPIFSLGALIAPESTPLYSRMQAANRLIAQDYSDTLAASCPWETNIIPQQMSQQTLLTGIKWLANQLYHPAHFGRRVLQFVERYQPVQQNVLRYRQTRRFAEAQIMQTIRDIRHLGAGESSMYKELIAATQANPDLQWYVLQMIFQYRQIRYMFEKGQFWEPYVTSFASPNFNSMQSDMASATSFVANRWA